MKVEKGKFWIIWNVEDGYEIAKITTRGLKGHDIEIMESPDVEHLKMLRDGLEEIILDIEKQEA